MASPTTSGALLEALTEPAAHRIALVTPYTVSVIQSLVDMARHAARSYDVIPQLEAELRIPVISANQVTMWAALRHLGTRAVGPYQRLIDHAARGGPVLPEEQEGWA